MSEAVLVGIISAVPATIAAIAAVIVSIHGNRQVEALHVSINGRMAQLLESVRTENLATGRAAGIEQERERIDP